LRLGLRKLGTRREGSGVLADVGQVSISSGRVTGRHGVGAESGGLGAEAGCVWSRLAAELGEVEVGSSAVSHVHRLEKASLCVVTIEDNAVEENAENLDDHLDDDADHGPVLKTANKSIIDFLTEDFRSMVVNTRPTPHILVSTVVP
jgi:hypothetical protein